MTTYPSPSGRYREDIQGLRALGALLIMVYHIWTTKVSGGVDVFFVISGYLIGGKVIRELDERGSLDLRKFWGGLVIRIFPSAYVVLLGTYILAAIIIPPTLWAGIISEILHATVHLQNIKLQRLLVDYLARENPPSPVQQFWALSVQIQFYIVFPLLAIVAYRVRIGKTTKNSFGLVILAALLLSLAYSVIMTVKAPTPTYFSTIARFWEFLSGVMLALVKPVIYKFDKARILKYGAGPSLLILLILGLVVPADLHFPGWIALIPVTAAAVLIASGFEGPTVWHRILSARPLVFLGGFSFTIYLWHWPILVFYRYYFPGILGFRDGLAIILASVVLAYLTNQLVENPLRVRRFSAWWKLIIITGLMASPLIIVALGSRYLIKSATLPGKVDQFHEYVEINSILTGIVPQNGPVALSWQRLLSAQNNKTEVLSNDCEIKESGEGLNVCEYGDKSSKRTVVLVGGSHASQWQPALDLVGRSKGIRVLSITKTSCPLGYMEWLKNESCSLWNKQVVAKILDLRPLAVVTNSTRSQRMGESREVEFVPEEYIKQWKILSENGIPVVGLRDNPWFESDPNICLALNARVPNNCYRMRSDVIQDINPADRLETEVNGFHSIDMNEFLCDSKVCVSQFDGNLLFWDRHHISRSYAKRLAQPLGIKLQRVLPSVFDAS